MRIAAVVSLAGNEASLARNIVGPVVLPSRGYRPAGGIVQLVGIGQPVGIGRTQGRVFDRYVRSGLHFSRLVRAG